MLDNLHTVASHALRWSSRDDLSAPLRTVAQVLNELLADVSPREPPSADTLDTIRILSCQLCRRTDRASCCNGTEGPCRLGWSGVGRDH